MIQEIVRVEKIASGYKVHLKCGHYIVKVKAPYKNTKTISCLDCKGVWKKNNIERLPEDNDND